MTITFYTFSKKRNSTAQPTGGTQYTGTLTGSSGVLNPTVVMDFGNTYPGYNYAYITEFGRYYWINEMTSIGGGLWNVSMFVDVLATYKTAIGAANKYILRSASDSDGSITDMKYPTKAGFADKKITSVSSGWTQVPSLGSYVVAVIDTNGGFGSTTLYSLTESQFETIRQTLAPSNYYQNISDPDLKNLAISVVNPMQYIAWVRYYPFSVPQGTSVTMHLGDIPIANMNLLGDTHVIDDFEFIDANNTGLHSHPMAAARGAYLNTEPYSIRFFTWLPVGMIHLPALMAGEHQIDAEYNIDVISGTGDLCIYSYPSNTLIYRTAFTCGVDVPVAQVVSSNPLKIVSGSIGIVSATMSAVAGNIAGSVASGVSAITDFLTSQVGEVQAFKPGSGSLAVDGFCRIYEYFVDIVDDDNPEFGRPLCQVKAISTLSGYVLCADGDIFASGATAPELAEIETYLTGGFFYA